jgi:2-octaprenyl-6-methoxyphenol hydroxylase
MTGRHYDYDLVIIGGGPVGMALALALRSTDISVLLLEARGLPAKTEDPRPLALSHGSRLVLQRLGVWQGLPEATPITTIHISTSGDPGRTVLRAGDAGVPALGYVLNHHDLFRGMHEVLRTSARAGFDYLTGAQVVKLETGTPMGQVEFQHEGEMKKKTARLLVLAEGGRLTGQIEGLAQHTHDYQQWAVVAHVETERYSELDGAAPENRTIEKPRRRSARSTAARSVGPQLDLSCGRVAFERFTPDGPVALLPFGERYALVWTLPPDMAKEVLALDDAAFLVRLHSHFGDRLGNFIGTGKRSGFPLALKYVTPVTACRTVLIGNAAQTLHPVAGQGFNLGLRDAWELAEEVIASPIDIGDLAMLEKYGDKRKVDSGLGRTFTDSLVRLFSNDSPALGIMRGIGLSALDCVPPVKRFVARRMMFGARG